MLNHSACSCYYKHTAVTNLLELDDDRTNVMRGLVIRQSGAADIPALADVHVASWQSGYDGLLPGTYLDSLTSEDWQERWHSILADSGNIVIAGEFDGKIVGFAVIGRGRGSNASVGELHMLYVHPDYWNQGVGTRLQHEAIALLSKAGFSDAFLWVLETNSRARQFYDNTGWTLDGERKQQIRSGVLCTEIRYIRKLNGETAS